MVFFLAFWFLFFSAIASAEKANLLLVTIDTLRADHLGCYGSRSVRTPNLDSLAERSLFFENALCQAPLTLPSHTSLLTGRYPYHHEVRDNSGSLDLREVTLAEILRKNGYHTYAFIGGFPLDHRFGLNQGFDVYDDVFPRLKNRSLDFRSERTAEQVVKAVRSTNLRPPFFVWVHFYDPHAPYLNGGYKGEIEFVDRQTGALLQEFKNFQPVIAVAGDHGESLGEHGELTHRIFVYDSTMRVPFWIYVPGMAPQKITSQVRLIDFLPTILDVLKIPVPENLDGAKLPKNAGAPSFLESFFPKFQLGWSALTAIRTNDWKYIQAPRPELYNLRSDAGETQNVIEKNREVARSFADQIAKLEIRNSKSEARDSKSTLSAEAAEQLAALGYVSGSSAAKESNIDPKDRIGIWNQIEKAVDLEKTKPEETITILEEAQKKDPANPMVLGFLAQKYAETGKLDQAMRILRQALQRDPANSLALYRMATVSLQDNQPAEARKWANSLHRLEPFNPDALILVARAELQLGNFDAASRNIREALRIDPRDLELRNDLGNLYLQTRKTELARSEFQLVLKEHPQNLQALNGLATCLFVQNDYPGSESRLKSALRIDPSDPQTKMNLALLYSKQGRTGEAIALYREVQSAPNTPENWKAEAAARLKELE